MATLSCLTYCMVVNIVKNSRSKYSGLISPPIPKQVSATTVPCVPCLICVHDAFVYQLIVYLLPEKPQSMSMHAHLRALSQHAAAEEKAEAKRADPTHHEAAVIRTIDAYRAVPKAKYAFPVTTNQDYGWDHPERTNDVII
jgi:hypothetical protein